MGGLEGAMNDAGQVGLHGVEVNGVLQPGGESGQCPVRVVAGAVKPAIHDPLHPAPHRIEQGGGGQRGGGDRHRGSDRQTWLASRTKPAYTPTSSSVTMA